jgi:hypothetical protein
LAALHFDYRDYQNGQLADVQQMIGKAGWLRISKLAIKTAGQTVEHILISAQTDAGAALDERTIDRLFLVPAKATTELGLTPPLEALSGIESAARSHRLKEAEDASAAFLMTETDKLDAYADDLEKAADAEIKGLDDEMKARRKAVRSNAALSVGDKVDEQRAIKKLEARRDELMLAKFERKKAIRREVEDILDSVQASLKLSPALDHLFTVRWELHG